MLSGSVNPATLDIILSPPLAYFDNSNFSYTNGIVGMGATSFLAVNINRLDTGSPIIVTPIKAASPQTTAPVKGIPVTLIGSSVSFNPATARIDDTTAVIAYADANANNNLACVLVYYDPVRNTASFGSILQLTSNTALQPFQVNRANI